MSDNVKNAVITIIFVSVLVITMIVNIAKKDGTISISERRKLEQFPSFSIYKLFNGKFFEKFDKYTTDQFTYRDNLRKLKVETELNIFKKKDYNNLYEYNGYIINQEYPLNEKSIENLANKVKQINDQYLTENNNVYFTIVPDKNYFVNKDNLKEFLSCKEVAACGGSWMVKREWIQNGEFDRIRNLIAEAAKLKDEIRSEK